MGPFDPKKNVAPRENLHQAPDETEVRSVLDAIRAARERTADPVDQEKFDQQEQEAKALYDSNANRTEWLSLADRVGNALTRIGAARAGLKAGVDLSKIDYGPGTDWEGRMARNQSEYKTELGRIGDSRATAERTRETETRDLDRKARALEPELDFQKYKYGQQYGTYQAGLRDEAIAERQEKSLRSAEKRAADREAARDAQRKKEEEDRFDKEQRRLSVSDLQKQLQEAEKEEEAANQAANILAAQPNLSRKTGEKLMQSYPAVMAKAGITPEDMQAIEESSQKPGVLWGTNPDPKKKQELIRQNLLAPRQERIRNLRQALDSAISTRGAQKAPATEVPATKEPTEQQVQKYAEQYRIPEEQARGILRKRLNP